MIPASKTGAKGIRRAFVCRLMGQHVFSMWILGETQLFKLKGLTLGLSDMISNFEDSNFYQEKTEIEYIHKYTNMLGQGI